MEKNHEYIRKKRPINFTMDDLEREKDEEDEAFDYNSKPGPSRFLPIAKPKFLMTKILQMKKTIVNQMKQN